MYRARLASLFSPFEFSASPQDVFSERDDVVETADGDEEKEFEFRFFAGEAVHRIVLRDEVVVKGEGGLVNMRDPRVFFVPKAVGERRLGLESMALSGEQVLKAAKRRAWGLEVPWRVKVIKVSEKLSQKAVSESNEDAILGVELDDSDAVNKKKKPGKKRRIILRERKKKRDELAELWRTERQRKEETEKEKRTRKNREKKLKRRMKERALKAAGGVEIAGSIKVEAEDSQSGEND